MRMMIMATLSLAACGTAHFSKLAQSSSCSAAKVTELKSWAFRVDGCGEPVFYRYWFKRNGLVHSRCCEAMSETNATATVAPADVMRRPQPAESAPICEVL